MKYFSRIVILIFFVGFSMSTTFHKINDLSRLSAKEESNDSLKRKTIKGLYNKLLKLVISNSGRINKFSLAFGTSDDDRYIVALEDINADETILKIPEKLIISTSHPELKSFCAKIEVFAKRNKLEHEANDLCLQLWVAKEREDITHSKFQHFIAFLPIKLDTFPLLFKKKEMAMIKNTYLEELIESERNYLEKDYSLLKKKNSSLLGKITQKEFNEAYELFYSRTYQFYNGQANLTGFVPLVDLFNYKTGNENKVGWKFNQETKQFIVYAIDNIKKGSKIFIEYGNHSNFQYLTYYGFTLAKNSVRPTYSIYVGEKRKQVIVDLSGDANMVRALEPLRRSISLKPAAKDGEEPKIISVTNELAALKALQEELDIRVKSWHSSYKQDILRLKNAVDVNEKNILRVISEEKKMVKIYHSLCVHFITILKHKKHSTLGKIQSKLVILNPHFRAYFEQLNSSLGLNFKTDSKN